jgi:hypothetical protein
LFGYDTTTNNTDTGVRGGLAVSATIGFLAAMAFGFGEELGWRGFLVPELVKIMGFTNVALISGAHWALWRCRSSCSPPPPPTSTSSSVVHPSHPFHHDRRRGDRLGLA